EASGIPRRINRQKLGRADLEAELSRPDSLRARVFAGMSELLRRRRSSPAFAPSAQQRLLNIDPRVFALVRETNGERMLCLHNVSNETIPLANHPEWKQATPLAPYEVRWEALPA